MKTTNELNGVQRFITAEYSKIRGKLGERSVEKIERSNEQDTAIFELFSMDKFDQTKYG